MKPKSEIVYTVVENPLTGDLEIQEFQLDGFGRAFEFSRYKRTPLDAATQCWLDAEATRAKAREALNQAEKDCEKAHVFFSSLMPTDQQEAPCPT